MKIVKIKKRKILAYRHNLLQENIKAKNKGDIDTYQNNCNQLKGIAFVLENITDL